MDAAADFRLRADPARGGVLTVALLTAMLALGYVGINYLYERFDPSPLQIFDSLSEATFDQPLPASLVASGGAQNQRTGNGYVSIHFYRPVESEIMKGPHAVIAYEIFPDEATSTQHWEEKLEELRLQEKRQEDLRSQSERRSRLPTMTFVENSLPVTHDNVCITIGNVMNDYCQIRVSSVWIDISSRLVLGGLTEEAYYPELAVAALNHLREAVPAVD